MNDLGRNGRRRVLLAGVSALVVPMTVLGCGGEEHKTGDLVQPDENAAKRQKEMEDFYKANPPGGKKKR